MRGVAKGQKSSVPGNRLSTMLPCIIHIWKRRPSNIGGRAVTGFIRSVILSADDVMRGDCGYRYYIISRFVHPSETVFSDVAKIFGHLEATMW